MARWRGVHHRPVQPWLLLLLLLLPVPRGRRAPRRCWLAHPRSNSVDWVVAAAVTSAAVRRAATCTRRHPWRRPARAVAVDDRVDARVAELHAVGDHLRLGCTSRGVRSRVRATRARAGGCGGCALAHPLARAGHLHGGAAGPAGHPRRTVQVELARLRHSTLHKPRRRVGLRAQPRRWPDQARVGGERRGHPEPGVRRMRRLTDVPTPTVRQTADQFIRLRYAARCSTMFECRSGWWVRS